MNLKTLHLNTIGQLYHDFQVTKAMEIKELDCVLRELTHLPTGAQIIHISNKDPENLFCLSFRTVPESSNGVAHILEHTVLCGSKKFPVKDPFFSMTRRSLNTYMNALTGSDFTCYPAASQVTKDFYNLLEVYLDAVFHPQLNELSFLQEGHRLEFANPSDPSSPLEYKGIVFNEMKGALASSNARLAEAMNKALFPNITYGINSGGDPKAIPQLTYEELLEFHKKFYHPSRTTFYFYGNFPLEKHLDFLATHILNESEKKDPLPSIPLQPRFTEPKRLSLEYPLDPHENPKDQTLISFGWLTCHILNQIDLLALCIVEIVLMDTDASPLKMAFLKSGLCKQAIVSMDTEVTEIPIVITLKGTNPESADALEKLLFETLKKIAAEGISLELIENALHQLEFHRSEITGNHTPFGLSLFMRSVLLQQHGGRAEDGLRIHSLLEELRKKFVKDPNYFHNLIEKYFLENSHFVRITMQPSSELMKLEEEEERHLLAQIQQGWSEKEKQYIVDRAATLAAFQEKQADHNADILPKILLEDVPKAPKHYLLTEASIGEIKVFHHDTFTNDIIYADLGFDVPALSAEDLPAVRLLALLIPQLGCGVRNYAQTLDYIQAHTGGVGVALAFNSHVKDSNLFSPTISVRGKALHHKSEKLFTIMYEMLQNVDFSDLERLKEILLKHYTTLQSGFVQNSLRYALNLAAKGIDEPCALSYLWFGLGYYQYIKNIVENIHSSIQPLAKQLKKLHDYLLESESPHLVITCTKETYEELLAHHFYDIDKIKTAHSPPWKACLPVKSVPSQGRTITAPVAFIGSIFRTTPYIDPDTPVLSVIAHLLGNKVLHARIREQGGAYGSGAVCNTIGAHFYFYSFRDPNIANTFKAFEESVQKIASGEFEAVDVEEAILEVIQGMDAPVAPGSRGDIAYGWLREGKTEELRQQFRNRLLATTKKDIIRVTNARIVPQMKKAVTVVFAGQELLEKENKQLQHPLPIEPMFS